MSERSETYHADRQPAIDEFRTETVTEEGPTGQQRRYLVYRLVGHTRINYCRADSMDAALVIAKALTSLKEMGEI